MYECIYVFCLWPYVWFQWYFVEGCSLTLPPNSFIHNSRDKDKMRTGKMKVSKRMRETCVLCWRGIITVINKVLYDLFRHPFTSHTHGERETDIHLKCIELKNFLYCSRRSHVLVCYGRITTNCSWLRLLRR